MLDSLARDDERVVRRVLDGCTDDFGVLVRRYLPTVYAVTYAQLGNHSDAEDAAQETFLSALTSLDQLRERRKFNAWLVSIARNTARRMGSKRRHEHEVLANTEAEPKEVEPGLEQRELNALVRHKVEELEESPREVLLLHYFAGKSTREIATLLGISPAAARKRLQRAREVLGAKLLESLAIPESHRNDLRNRERTILSAAAGASLPWLGSKAAAAETGTAISAAAALKFAAIPFVLAAIGAGIWIVKEQDVSVGVLGSAGNVILELGGPASTPAPALTISDISIASDDATQPEESIANDAPTSAETTTDTRVDGVVLDSNNAPVAGAKVMMRDWTERRRRNFVEYETTTNTDGRFDFAGIVPTKEMAIHAVKEGMVLTESPDLIPIPPGGVSNVAIFLAAGATVRGRVVDKDGRAVADKEVTDFHENAENILRTTSATTAADGSFEISGLHPGAHTLQVIPEEQWRKAIEDARYEVEPGETKSGIEIVYPGEDFVVAGRVVDDSGRPINKVFVQLLGVHGPDPVDEYTDEDGRFRLVRIPEGKYSMMVQHQRYDGTFVMATTGVEDMEIVLSHADKVSLTGRVVDAITGQPITRFQIQQEGGIFRTLDPGRMGFFEWFEDIDGRFSMDGLEVDQVTLSARAPGYAISSIPITKQRSISREITFRLDKSPTISGRVLGADDEPIADAYMLLDWMDIGVLSRFSESGRMMDDWLGRNAAARSKRDGSFTIDSLVEGVQRIVVFHPQRGIGMSPLSRGFADAEDLTIRVQSTGVIEGRVLHGDQPVEHAAVTVEEVSDTQRYLGHGTTDAEGRYRLVQVEPGPVRLKVRLPSPRSTGLPLGGRSVFVSATVASDSVTAVDIVFPPAQGVIEATVTIDGLPATNGRATLSLDGPFGPETNELRFADGTFRIEQVPPGNVTLRVLAGIDSSSWRSTVVEFELAENEMRQIAVELPRRAVLTGHVTGLRAGDSAHLNVFEGNVDLTDHRGNPLAPLLRGRAATGESGEYTIAGLTDGTYSIQVFVNQTPESRAQGDYARLTSTFEVSGGDVQLEFAY